MELAPVRKLIMFLEELLNSNYSPIGIWTTNEVQWIGSRLLEFFVKQLKSLIKYSRFQSGFVRYRSNLWRVSHCICIPLWEGWSCLVHVKKHYFTQASTASPDSYRLQLDSHQKISLHKVIPCSLITSISV